MKEFEELASGHRWPQFFRHLAHLKSQRGVGLFLAAESGGMSLLFALPITTGCPRRKVLIGAKVG